jgi:hypothetical protein
MTFYGNDLTNIPDVIERNVYFSIPIFTRHFVIHIDEAAPVVNIKFDIIGQTSEDRYSANPNMEPVKKYQSKLMIQ